MFFTAPQLEIVQEQCHTCPLGQKPCPVLNVQLAYNQDQQGNQDLKGAMNLLVSEKGTCQLKPLLKRGA